MPKRRKRQRTIISDAETSAVPVQETAEAPPVEPEVACQPRAPDEGALVPVFKVWHQSIVASRRQLARSRKKFAKRELHWMQKSFLSLGSSRHSLGASAQMAVASGMRQNGWIVGSLISSYFKINNHAILR